MPWQAETLAAIQFLSEKRFCLLFSKLPLEISLQRLEETAVGNNPIEAMRTFPDDDFHNGCELRRATSIVNVT
jgi:hypothetical protein